MSKLSGIITLAVPALLVLALDQASKAWIVAEMAPREIRVLVQGFLRLRYTENTGAAFGIFQGGGAVLSIASMAIILGIMVFAVKASHGSKLSMLALGLVLGGALGNLVDRVSLGYVRDFIEAYGVQANINNTIYSFPVFNLADSSITVGVVLLIITLLFGGQEEPAPVPDSEKAAVPGEETRPTLASTSPRPVAPTPAGWAGMLLVMGGMLFLALRSARDE